MAEKTGKRDRQITIRVSEADLSLMKRAAEAAWPGAILSTASVMLSLSRMKAEEILQETQPRKRK
jgi:uncharacterized protein (DUF1778 family)